MNNINNTKTALLILDSDEPNDFQVKNIVLRISKEINNKQITPLCIQGISYTRAFTNNNQQQLKNF